MHRSLSCRLLSGFLATLLVWGTLPVRVGFADEAPEATTVAVSSRFVPEETLEASTGISEALEEVIHDEAEALVQAPESKEEPGVAYSLAAPAGTEQKSAVTPQAIVLPKAEGSIQGMGESFSPVLSSGTATFTVPIALPAGRHGVQPSLALGYSSSHGNGEVGFGWGMGTPFIARQADRGIPRYVDQAAWHPQEDRFFYNGGQELVPVDSAKAEINDCGATGCAPIPAELKGWQQYRARVEGGFLRFFRAPNAKRWVVQGKDGTRFDFGLLPLNDGPGEVVSASAGAMQSEHAGGKGRVYRWLLTRMSDPHGSVVYYLYDEDQGQRYLADLYYVSPHATCGTLPSPSERLRCSAPLANYGRRVRLVYEDRPDVFTSYVSGWAVATARRVRRIEITATQGTVGVRTLVRRYHLGYDTTSFHSLLATVQVEGRPERTDPSTGVTYADLGGGEVLDEGALGESTVGPRLPGLRFRYSAPPETGETLPGFGGIDATVHQASISPPHSVDEERAELFDVNSDGLPDLLVTEPAFYRTKSGAPAAGVFFNGFAGDAATPDVAGTFSGAVPMELPQGLSGVMMLSNPNVAPMDIDADGRSDLLHMPRLENYGYFTAVRSGEASVSPAKQRWRWEYLPRTLPAGFLDPRIDLSRDAPSLRAFDVNHDRLIDVVKTTGTSIQTWLNLGWLPAGDGRFGSARYDAAKKSWVLSTAPLESCLPHAGVPLDFADPEVRLGDLNGDGIQDLVRIRKGRVIYWPGRGAGQWGTTECASGFQGDGYVEMATPPMEVNPDLRGVHLADLNADGADDVVQVRFRDVDVWFNQAGQGFTPRITARGTPEAPDYAPRIRFADMDGTGTVDILYGHAKNWRWLDPMGGQRPRLLTSIDGGLGALTEIAYGSSVEDYLADLRQKCSGGSCERFTGSELPKTCTSCESDGSPVVSTVVRQVTTTDRLDRLGAEENRSVTRYAYHDGHYDGVEMEFRGFGAADATAVGDEHQPTASTRTYFHQGRRSAELGKDKLADNPDEALKALAYLTEVHDGLGHYLSSTLSTTTIRKLLVGQNGVAVSHAVGSRSYDLRWNPASESLRAGTITLPTVLRSALTEKQTAVRQRHSGFAVVLTTVDDVDHVGNVKQQTAWGRVQGEFGEAVGDESIVTVATPENLSTSATGWLWRTRESYVLGHGTTVGLGDTTNTWNATGDLVTASTRVEQAVTPLFGGDGQAQDLGAPAPESLVASTAYDVWGNATASCAGGDVQAKVRCLRYGKVTYDAAYALVAETESLAVGRAGADFAYLTTKGEWDLGLGALTAAVDANGERSTVTYDGFGRLTSVTLPPVSGCGGMPSTRLRYELTTDPQAVPVSRMFTTALTSCASAEEGIETMAYVDGLGRVRATLSTGEDTARPWVKAGVSLMTARGTVWKAFQPEYYTGSPDALGAVLSVPQTPATQAAYDAFGRQTLAIAEDGATTETKYFALSTEVWDPNDRDLAGPHGATPTTERQDGHGRTIDQVLQNKPVGSSAVEYYRLWTDYRADGAVVRVRRAQTTTDAHRAAATIVGGRFVERTFTYDTVGRRIATTDPDTDNRSNGATWRYLFNRVGDLAAVRDPRGCGQNYYYDHGGRLIGEQYVGCGEAQAHEGPADTLAAGVIGFSETSTAQPVDVRLYFDAYAGTFAPVPSTLEDYPAGPGGVLGRATGAADRGQRSVVAYDRRGNAIWAARQLALIPPAGTVPTIVMEPSASPTETLTPPPNVAYDEAHTYVRTAAYDHANRAVGMVLPRDPDFDGALRGPRIAGTLSFNARGLPAQATALIVGGGTTATATNGALSFGAGAQVQAQPVLQKLVYDRDGLVLDTTYGDDRGGTRGPTTTFTRYDVRRRPTRSMTVRTSTGAAIGTERPLSAVGTPFAQTLAWDLANNLVAVHDDRLATEWPAGHRPQSVTLQHDALYRVGDAAYTYSHEPRAISAEESFDTATSPYDLGTDWRDEQARTRTNDPMRTAPAPMVAREAPDRVASLTWSYDWLGNMKDWGDDAHAFYERSIGSITNGADVGAGSAPAQRPSALYLASDLAGPPADRGGYVELDYGVSGNLVAMTVHAKCVDKDALTICRDAGGSDLAARRGAWKAACACASEQHTQYRWDEVNRLAEARRYDRKNGSGGWTLAARQRYRYDGQNVRTVKQTRDPAAELPPPAICAECEAPPPTERVALYIYPGDFERRGLVRTADRYAADATLGTETQYLVAGARIVWQKGDPTLGLDSEHRITLGIGDLIGTTSAVLDLRSGELIEHDTYYPHGARETYLTTSQASIAPEPAGFTGKESDEEVGLTYFGERYLIPRLGRWASPDPLAIHALGGGEAMNSYHYVSGNLLQARDPLGLETQRQGSVDDRLQKALPVNNAPDGVVAGDYFFLTDQGASKKYEREDAAAFLGEAGENRLYRFDPKSHYSLVDGFQRRIEDPTSYIRSAFEKRKSDRFADAVGWINTLNLQTSDGPNEDHKRGIYGGTCQKNCTELTNGQLAFVGAVGIVELVGLDRLVKALSKVGKAFKVLRAAGGAGKTVLGKFPDYVKLSDDLAARRFSIPTKIWNNMTSAEQWAANRKFLDRMVNRGDEIILANPVKNVSEATGWFGRELNYLVEQGFRLSSDGRRMIR